MDGLKPQFENESEFENAKKYIEDFFYILINENEFNTQVVNNLRG